MHWLIQNNMYSEEGFTSLLDALTRLSLPHSVHKVVPFAHVLKPEPVISARRVIVMGTYTLAHIARSRGWEPGSFHNENFDCVIQRARWRERMLNFWADSYRLKDVPFQAYPFFIRPTEDTKAFTGTVMDWIEFDEWRTRVLELRPEDGATMSGETWVSVAPTKEIHREYRLWVIKQRVVTASLYKIGHRKTYAPNVDERVIAFGEEAAQEWSPADAYCLDIADTPEGLRIIEVNNLNSAGFYAADMNKLVMAIEDNFGGVT